MRVLGAVTAALHYLALGVGLPSIWHRARLLGGSLDRECLRRVFLADSLWGIAAVLWLMTGAMRAFGGLEKGAGFYLGSWLFYLKLGLVTLILALEVLPMVGLIRWRIALTRGQNPDVRKAPLYRSLSFIQLSIVIAIVFVAAFMARGFGRMGR
jgi:putative membrane protein